MSNILTDTILKEELTAEQWEKYQQTKKEFGIDEAIAQLPHIERYKTFEYTMINKNIKLLRKENKLTQEELANILDVSQKEYWRYEQEGYSVNIMKLSLIALFYNISIDWITGFHRERKPFFNTEENTYVNGYNLQKIKEAKEKGIKYQPHKMLTE